MDNTRQPIIKQGNQDTDGAGLVNNRAWAKATRRLLWVIAAALGLLLLVQANATANIYQAALVIVFAIGAMAALLMLPLARYLGSRVPPLVSQVLLLLPLILLALVNGLNVVSLAAASGYLLMVGRGFGYPHREPTA
ncbi:MAG: hypothetical protein AMS22_11105 [Thiotrichales bacterium SG8_50]|nr:MAG: hypothetical protein AMS22_11105 [Thiotrichales bacterium SG8_50]